MAGVIKHIPVLLLDPKMAETLIERANSLDILKQNPELSARIKALQLRSKRVSDSPPPRPLYKQTLF